MDFLVEQVTDLAPPCWLGKFRGRHLGHDSFSLMAPRRLGPRIQRYPESDTIQPVCQVLAPADRAGLAEQHQERGLKGILGAVDIG